MLLICWSETNPEFVNNFYIGTGLFIVKTENELDTITNKENSSLTDLSRIERYENGTYLRKSLQFSFKKSLLIEINEFNYQLSSTDNQELLTLGGDNYWSIKEIKFNGKNLLLDSCHRSYVLSFDTLNLFSQGYGNGNTECTATINIEKTKSDNKVEYWYSIIKCRFRFSKGVWRTRENILIMMNEDQDKLCFYDYLIDRR